VVNLEVDFGPEVQILKLSARQKGASTPAAL